MAYIFLDESGDLGFSKGSSKWFIFTIALTDDYRALERVIKKARRTLRKKHNNVRELHAYHADEITRKRVLTQLAALQGLKVLCIVLNKDKVYTDLQNQKNHLYNYTANILLDRLHSKNIIPLNETIELFIDRKDTNKNLRESFEQYLMQSLSGKREGIVNIKLRASHEEKALQAVDFMSWAIFRKYEQSDYSYYEIIKGSVIEENLLFP